MSNDLIHPGATVGPSVVLAGQLVLAVGQLEQNLIALPAITDQASCDAVRTIMVAASKLAGQVDAQRANAKQPWMAVAKAIDATAKPVVERLEAVKIEAKTQITTFLLEQDRIKREAAQAQLAAQAAATAALQKGNAPQLQVTVLPQEITAPTTLHHTVRLLDLAMIPMEFFDLNTERLRQALVAGRSIPGAELVEERRVVAR